MEINVRASIIIPVYNVQSYLAEALESVIHQTYSNLEILIIDDGSTDGSGEICDEYAVKDNRIHVIHQENKGLSAARNVGLDMMTGEVVAFLDSDDAYYPEFVEKMIAAMIRNQADLVICRYASRETSERMRSDDLEYTGPSIPAGIYDRKQALEARLNGKINNAVWNKLYRKSIWSHIRFLEGHVFEDWDTIYKILNLSDITVVLDESLYFYRVRSESICSTFSWKNFSDMMYISSRVEAFITENLTDVLSEEMLQKERIEHFRILIRSYAGLYKYKKDIDIKSERKKLRLQIIAKGEEIKMESCSFKIRVAYAMIYFCPGFFRMAHSAYVFLK